MHVGNSEMQQKRDKCKERLKKKKNTTPGLEHLKSPQPLQTIAHTKIKLVPNERRLLYLQNFTCRKQATTSA